MLKVGDLVYHCVKWTPGKENYNTQKGIGVVTMLVTKDEVRKARVLWKNGNIAWLPETNLVNKKNIIGSLA